MAQQSTGVIGIGAMGMGMAASLARNGCKPRVYDIDSGRMRHAAGLGMVCQDTVSQLVAECTTIFLVVVDSSQIRQVFGELLPVLGPAHTVAICSTIAPADMQAFAQQVCSRGAAFIDAPISGGPARAEAGTMSMMLAAPADTLEPVMPILTTLSDRRFIISAHPGDATKAKLVNNLLAGIHLVAAAEAFAMARRYGLDEQQMLELVRASSGQSWMLEDRLPRALRGDLAPRAAAPVITKDLTLATAEARQLGVESLLGEAARLQMQRTCEQGWQTRDDAAVISRLLGDAP